MSASAVEDLIADAVAYELNLNTQPWAPLSSAAARAYDNVFTQAELASLRVVCVPLTEEQWERLTRGGQDKFDFGVTVDLQQAVAPQSVADVTGQIEALNAVAQQMHDWFRQPHTLSTTGGAATDYECLAAKRPEIFVPDRLWHDHVWETYIELTVRAYR
jgi:hypothetical protein